MPRLLFAGLILVVCWWSWPCAAIEVPWVGNLFAGEDDEESAPAPVKPSERPGTPEFWDKHGGKAEFVPGEGFRVPGYEGRFDREGRPIDAPVDEVTVKLVDEVKSSDGLIPGLDPKETAERVKSAVGLGPNEEAAREALDEGVALFQEEKYSRAADRFETAASRWPGSVLQSRSLFNLGEAHFFDESYEDAADAYILLLDKHPNTPRLNDAIERLWAIAQYWEARHFAAQRRAPLDYNPFESTRPTFDTIGHAIRLYDAIRLNDPTGPRADDAIMATAGAYFRREMYRDADYHYGLLRTDYPRSEHQFESHVLGLQCKMRVYQGPEYDGKPLEEAQKLEERVRVNFAGRLSLEERDRLRDVRAQLAAMIEERDLRMAEYYEDTSHYGAAGVYLTRVIEDYPDSPAARTAQDKLDEIGEKRAQPPTRMAWFVDLFPKNRRRLAIEEVLVPSPDGAKTLVAEESDEETATR